MANITLSDYGTVTTAATGIDKTKYGKASTATGFINPTYSSITRVSSTADAPNNFNISDLTAPAIGSRKSERGLLQGRRPNFGLLFPRGYYNR